MLYGCALRIQSHYQHEGVEPRRVAPPTPPTPTPPLTTTTPPLAPCCWHWHTTISPPPPPPACLTVCSLLASCRPACLHLKIAHLQCPLHRHQPTAFPIALATAAAARAAPFTTSVLCLSTCRCSEAVAVPQIHSA
eukprot:6212567-Pleurochrysis_carterae.AAC.2